MKVDMEKAESLLLNLLDKPDPIKEDIIELFNVVNVFETPEESCDAAAIIYILFRGNERVRKKSLTLKEWSLLARKLMKTIEPITRDPLRPYNGIPQFIEIKNDLEKNWKKIKKTVYKLQVR